MNTENIMRTNDCIKGINLQEALEWGTGRASFWVLHRLNETCGLHGKSRRDVT